MMNNLDSDQRNAVDLKLNPSGLLAAGEVLRQRMGCDLPHAVWVAAFVLQAYVSEAPLPSAALDESQRSSEEAS